MEREEIGGSRVERGKKKREGGGGVNLIKDRRSFRGREGETEEAEEVAAKKREGDRKRLTK